MPATKKTLSLTALLALVLAKGACGGDPSPEAARGDDTPELSVFASDLEETFELDGAWLVSPSIPLEHGANRVAIMATLAEGETTPTLRVRGKDVAGSGEWHDAEWTFEELGHLAGVGLLDGVYAEVQLAVPADRASAFSQLTFSPAYTEALESVELVPNEAAEELRGELAFVGVKPRSAWGARGHRCSTRQYGYQRMALHHTAARAVGNVELALRQAQAYHMDGRGYCDIAYHFGVAQDGRVFELRPLEYRGGHTRNNNVGNVGIVFLGCFDPACGNDQPSQALLGAGAGMVRMMHLLEGIAINSDRVRGHRDHSYAQTACPGSNLYARLEEIRQRARDMGAAPPPPPPPSSSPAPTPPAGCGIAGAGKQLAPGQSWLSCDGRLKLAHQGDGNVVLYQGATALWSTQTANKATGALVMQGDGNLVLYSPWSQALWSSGTYGKPNAHLAVQNDGNLVIYHGNTAVWASHTQASASPPPPPPPPPPAPAPAPAPSSCGIAASGKVLAKGAGVSSCDGRFLFVHQADGNVVLYQGGSALWASGTHGKSTSSLVMQGDGNLVLYGQNGTALWSSGTSGHPGSRLAVQNDGNVVVYGANNAPLWNTGTCCR